MARVSRRQFLKVGGAAAATGAALAGSGFATAKEGAAPGATTLPYPREGITKAGALQVNEPLTFQYPDADSPCQILKAGRAVPGGIGPAGDIVAYSTTCTHMGCPLTYDKEARTYKCGCHCRVRWSTARLPRICRACCSSTTSKRTPSTPSRSRV